ncbi:MAG: hypothetical protein DPW13_12805 [Planctomycetes bacterium]|nr:hypothetical protein [Planctomycetota bacterium]NUQ09458.1 hypothetical protein [Phycisphaerae bacterium]
MLGTSVALIASAIASALALRSLNDIWWAVGCGLVGFVWLFGTAALTHIKLIVNKKGVFRITAGTAQLILTPSTSSTRDVNELLALCTSHGLSSSLQTKLAMLVQAMWDRDVC